MFWCATLDLLAQVPPTDMYANPIKLAAIVLVFVLWAYFAQWADKDTVAVNTYRELWNLVQVGLGTTGLAVAILVPNFLIGFPIMAVLLLGGMVAYVLHRNGLVKPEDTICTAAHLRRMREQGVFGKKKQVKEIKERVRLTAANRKVVLIPAEEEEREQYRLTQDLLFDMLWRRAAVVDLVPLGQTTRITYQIDGLSTEREGLVRLEGEAIIHFLKTIGGLSLEERRKPQRGKIMASVGENRYQVLVETAGSTAGEKLRLKVVGLEAKGKIPDLGFTPKQLETVRAVMDRPRGLVLLTAPAGLGLTTTVYSFVRSHDAFLQNIQMLEYEKELDMENVTQKVYVPADDKTFTTDLQRMVRSDPDILVFPEIREKESAALIAQAAGEKIRMYVALKAEDVFDALRKWLGLVGDRAAAAKSLWMIANQRLVRKLCTECKQPYKPEAAMLKKLNMPADAVLYRQPEAQFDKHGNPVVCQACQGTGYVGRAGVFDLLLFDDELREVLRTASSLSDVQSFALKRGGLGLQTQAIQKVLDGTTSIQEVVRVIRGQTKSTGEPASGKAPAAGATGKPAPQPRPQPKPQAGKKPA
jgi:type IV pilus assembly protein PilB